MRCHICNAKLDDMVPSPFYKGGFAPCVKCDEVSRDASLERIHLTTEDIDPIETDSDVMFDTETCDLELTEK